MPGFTRSNVWASVRQLIQDTGATKVFALDSDFDEPFVRQAVQEYSERKPRRVPFFQLVITAGTGEYSLPADWLRRDEASWRRAYGTPQPGYQYTPYPATYPNVVAGIPYPPGWLAPGGEIRFLDDEQRVVIDPAPTADATLKFDYLGLHVVDPADATKTTIKASDQTAVEQLAAARVLDAISVEEAFLTKYKLARGLEVDNSQTTQALQVMADGYRKRAYAQMIGPVLMRG